MASLADRIYGSSLVECLAGGIVPGPSRTGHASQAGRKAPPALTGGVELQATSVGLDWLSASGDRGQFHQVVEWCVSYWAEAAVGPGRNFYKHSYRWATGAIVNFEPLADDQDHAWWNLELPGAVMAEFKSVEQAQVIEELATMYVKLTRLDLALDLRGEEIATVGLIRDACERGELCQLRSYRQVVDRAANGRLRGETVYCGSREGRTLLRAYDKGLEQGGKVAGRWVRIEVEVRKELARHAWSMLRQAIRLQRGDRVTRIASIEDKGISTDSFESCITAMIFGSVDFRERSGKSRSLSRRRQASWWVSILSYFSQIRLAGKQRVTVRLDSHLKWLRKSVLPGLKAMMALTGETADSFLSSLGWSKVEPRFHAAALQLQGLVQRGVWHGGIDVRAVVS